MRILHFFFLPFLIGLAFGCNRPIVDDNTRLMDSLYVIIENDYNMVFRLDSNRIAAIKPVIDAYMKFFTVEHFDTAKREFYLNEISALASCQKYSSRLENKTGFLQSEVAISKTQMENLRHDYQYGIISGKEFDEALRQEVNHFMKVHQQISKNVNGMMICLDNFDQLTAKLDSARIYILRQNE
jgi:hypothetical protein